jgi:hypothetical protein
VASVGVLIGYARCSTDLQDLRRMHDTGNYTITDLAELFAISRPTVYRTIQHGKAKEGAA